MKPDAKQVVGKRMCAFLPKGQGLRVSNLLTRAQSNVEIPPKGLKEYLCASSAVYIFHTAN